MLRRRITVTLTSYATSVRRHFDDICPLGESSFHIYFSVNHRDLTVSKKIGVSLIGACSDVSNVVMTCEHV